MKISTTKATESKEPTLENILRPSFKSKIDKSASGLVMDILSKLYTYPLAAAIREYTSNAIDSHRAVNQTKPVEIKLPSASENDNLLSIRDYGKGLDSFDIMTIYANFGTSDKRESDEFIGGFGIGSKSGLAISNTIYVTTWKNNKEHKFCIKRTKDGIVTQFLRENVDAPNIESGTRIDVYVDEMYKQFYSETQDFWKIHLFKTLAGWSKKEVIVLPRKDSSANKIINYINNNRIPDTWQAFEHGFVTQVNPNLYIDHGFIIGGVLYTNMTDWINEDMDHIKSHISRKSNAKGMIETTPFVVNLDIGKTKVNYSREQILFLESKDTLNHILEQIDGLANDIEKAVNEIKALNLSSEMYAKRLDALKLFSKISESGTYNYTNMLYETPNFSLLEPQQIDYIEITIGTSRFINTYKTHEYHQKYRFKKANVLYIVAPQDKSYKAQTYKRLISDCLNIISNKYPSVTMLKEYSKLEGTRILGKNQNKDIYVMDYKSLSKIPEGFRYGTISYEDLANARNDYRKESLESRQHNLSNSSIPKSQKAYVMTVRGPHSVPDFKFLQDIRLNDETKALLLHSNSCFAFNTNDSNTVAKIMASILQFNTLICTRTKVNFDKLKEQFPNINTFSDDELLDMIGQRYKDTHQIINDNIYKTLMYHASQQIITSDHKPINIAQCLQYPDNDADIQKVKLWLNSMIEMKQHIDRVIDGKSEHTFTAKLIQQIINENTTQQIYPRTESYNLRLLTTILKAQSSMFKGKHDYAMLEENEIIDIITKVKQEYHDDIETIKNVIHQNV